MMLGQPLELRLTRGRQLLELRQRWEAGLTVGVTVASLSFWAQQAKMRLLRGRKVMQLPSQLLPCGCTGEALLSLEV